MCRFENLRPGTKIQYIRKRVGKLSTRLSITALASASLLRAGFPTSVTSQHYSTSHTITLSERISCRITVPYSYYDMHIALESHDLDEAQTETKFDDYKLEHIDRV